MNRPREDVPVRAANRSHVRFLCTLAAVGAALLLICAAVNFEVDPYGLAGRISDRRFPFDLTFEREVRFNIIAAKHPSTLFMGSSQSAVAFDPHDPSMPDRHAFNAAIDGGTLSENVRLLREAASAGKVERVVLGLSYNMTEHTDPDRFNDVFLNVSSNPVRVAEAFLSIPMFRSSLKSLFDRATGRPPDMYDDGQLTDAVMQRQMGGYGSVRAAFDDISAPSTGDLGLFATNLRAFLAIACKAHANITVALLPDHAVDLELFIASGQWNRIKQWKRDVVAADSQAPCPVRTVDFEDYNSVTTEPLPTKGSRERMKYYWDPGHFTPLVGKMMLTRIFASDSAAPPPDFGHTLRADNIEAKLKVLDDQRQAYEAGNHSEIAAIALAVATSGSKSR